MSSRRAQPGSPGDHGTHAQSQRGGAASSRAEHPSPADPAAGRGSWVPVEGGPGRGPRLVRPRTLLCGTSDTFLSQLGPQSPKDGGVGRGRAPGSCSLPGGFLLTHRPSTSDSHPWQASGEGWSLSNQANPPVPGKQRITAKLSGADSTPPACLGKETPAGLSSKKPPGSSVPGRPTHHPTPRTPLPPSRSQSRRCRGSHCWRGRSPGGPMSPGEAETRGGPSVLGSCEAPRSRGLLVYKDPWFGL